MEFSATTCVIYKNDKRRERYGESEMKGDKNYFSLPYYLTLLNHCNIIRETTIFSKKKWLVIYFFSMMSGYYLVSFFVCVYSCCSAESLLSTGLLVAQ